MFAVEIVFCFSVRCIIHYCVVKQNTKAHDEPSFDLQYNIAIVFVYSSSSPISHAYNMHPLLLKAFFFFFYYYFFLLCNNFVMSLSIILPILGDIFGGYLLYKLPLESIKNFSKFHEISLPPVVCCCFRNV